MAEPTRYPVAYYRPADRLPDDETNLRALDLLTSRAQAATLQVNHQVRVGSSHSTLDGLPEFG
ncbi:hypothetical protein BKG68_13580 [Mycobacteroides saopaulense]|uniref:Uncharacterized protein n=1 Tax=Mycobacteroides saopaulense TaxID=1578165 RepID=A0ABX3C219_9MYCO|nr:hypothetical protein BKG68_13580 [Mycobacteroides saopaulense]OHU11044.1 hypothetical protein BKG73_06615 [Mycobacteroides saopaulense]